MLVMKLGIYYVAWRWLQADLGKVKAANHIEGDALNIQPEWKSE